MGCSVGEDIEIDEGIMGHEIDHAVLTDVVDDGNAWQREGQQQTRKAAEDADGVDEDAPHVAVPGVGAHGVFAMKPDITHHKGCNEDEGEDDGACPAQLLHHHLPHSSEEEKEDAHEHVIEAEPQGAVDGVEPIGDEWEEEDDPMEIAYFLDEMDGDIGREEGHEEPARAVSVAVAGHPEVRPLERWHLAFHEDIGEDGYHAEIDDGSDDAPCDVGYKQTFHPIFAISNGITAYGLVEIAGLEEEETHEEEGPAHEVVPRDASDMLPTKSTHRNSVVAHHANDAKAAKKIEGMVTLSHHQLNVKWQM